MEPETQYSLQDHKEGCTGNLIEEKESEKANKKLMDSYTTTMNKVQAIRVLNKQAHEWMVMQKTMVTWHKQISDAPLPATNQSLLTRYADTIGRGDAPVPVFGAILPPAATSLS